MDSVSVVKDLCDRMALLHNRYDVVFRRTNVPGHLPYIPLAEALAAGLAADHPEAAKLARAVVDPADLDRPEFWATPLGRLMFAAGAFRDKAVTQTLAAAVLGCSRQWVHQMVVRGLLRTDAGLNPAAREVYAKDVREMLKTKLDSLVK